MDVIIRDIMEKDIDSIIEIEKEAFSTPWSKEAFITEIRDNLLAKYIVAKVDGKIVGYAGIWFILNEGHITNIAVRESHKGQGIGNQLLEGLITYCKIKNIKHMTLEVRKSNYIAQNLYKKHGFINYGIRPNYYQDNNEDAIIMWRSDEKR